MAQYGTRCLAGQLLTQAGAGVHKRSARYMQAHGFEQHLVAIGSTVKSASAFAVVSGRLRLQQLGAADQAQRGLFADLGFFFVGQARGHRPGRHKHRGQMPKV